MPRRYRPPTRRRRAKKQPLPGQAPVAPETPLEGDELPDAGDLTAPEDFEEAEALPYENDEDEEEYEPEPVPVVRRHEVRHVIARDHSHVIADLQRIALIVGFIMAGIIITAILR